MMEASVSVRGAGRAGEVLPPLPGDCRTSAKVVRFPPGSPVSPTTTIFSRNGSCCNWDRGAWGKVKMILARVCSRTYWTWSQRETGSRGTATAPANTVPK